MLERHISAIGARWGIMSEEAFREGIKGLLDKEFNVKVERWEGHDDAGLVYGYPSVVGSTSPYTTKRSRLSR